MSARMRRKSWLAKYSARESWRPVCLSPTGLAMSAASRGKAAVKGDGDLEGAEERPPEVVRVVGNRRQDVTNARLNGVISPDGHVELRERSAWFGTMAVAPGGRERGSAGGCQKAPGGVTQAFHFCGTNCGTGLLTYCFY